MDALYTDIGRSIADLLDKEGYNNTFAYAKCCHADIFNKQVLIITFFCAFAATLDESYTFWWKAIIPELEKLMEHHGHNFPLLILFLNMKSAGDC